MKLRNIIVTFTVVIPELEVDKERGLLNARGFILYESTNRVSQGFCETQIKDCPDYPALCD